jgi:hypothetical protein
MGKSSLEKKFDLILLEHRLKEMFADEVKFHPSRRWRFDYADWKNMVAVEIEGGTWNNGGHSRGAGYQKDTEKYNEAVKLGWRVLRYTGKTMQNFPTDYEVLTRKGISENKLKGQTK